MADRFPDAWVIGSDQVAELDGLALGKPGTHEAAVAQLSGMSGRAVRFHTSLCLARAGHEAFEALDLTTVRFRTDIRLVLSWSGLVLSLPTFSHRVLDLILGELMSIAASTA